MYINSEVKYDNQTNNNTAGQNQVYTQGAATATLSAEWTYIQKVTDTSGSGGGSGSEPSSGNEPGGDEPGSSEPGGGSGLGSEPTGGLCH